MLRVIICEIGVRIVLRRVLSGIVALAMLSAPCAMVGAQAAMTSESGAHAAPAEPAGAPHHHCPGDSSNSSIDRDCATNCHGWDIARPAPEPQPDLGGDLGPAWQMTETAGVGFAGIATPPAARHLRPPRSAQPVYALTARYRI